MKALRIGDVCEFFGLYVRCTEFNGTECTIVGGLQERYGSSTHQFRNAYLVRTALDGKEWAVEPEYLRLRKPPEEPATNYDGNERGDWDLCPWQPSKVNA